MASKGTLTVRIIGDAKSFNQSLDDMGGKLKGFGKAIPKIAGAAFLGAGVAIGGALTSGFFEALDRDAAQDRLAARFGLSENEAKRLGQVAADVYTSAWGDSVGGVLNVIADLNEELGDLGAMPAEQIEHLATAAIALQDVWGIETVETIDAIGQLLRNDLVDSAEEAFDVIAKGLQDGANRSDDFLETLVEYAEPLRSLGLDAEYATGILIAGLEAGAFSADKVGDAIKEFSIRAIDGSKATSRAFEIIGLDADEMARKIAEGGPSAREAMSEIIGALGDVGDAVAQDEAGVGLFGSMWEDVGPQVIAALDPVHGALENVEGTVDRVTSTAEDNISARLTAAWRRFTDSVPQAIADSGMLDAIDRILDAFDEDGLGGAIAQVKEEWERAWPDIKQWLEDEVVPALGELGRAAGLAFAKGLMMIVAEAMEFAWEQIKGLPGLIVDTIANADENFPAGPTGLGEMLDNQPIEMVPVPVPDSARNNPDRTDIDGGRTATTAGNTYNVTINNPQPAATETDVRRLQLAYP